MYKMTKMHANRVKIRGGNDPKIVELFALVYFSCTYTVWKCVSHGTEGRFLQFSRRAVSETFPWPTLLLAAWGMLSNSSVTSARHHRRRVCTTYTTRHFTARLTHRSSPPSAKLPFFFSLVSLDYIRTRSHFVSWPLTLRVSGPDLRERLASIDSSVNPSISSNVTNSRDIVDLLEVRRIIESRILWKLFRISENSQKFGICRTPLRIFDNSLESKLEALTIEICSMPDFDRFMSVRKYVAVNIFNKTI